MTISHTPLSTLWVLKPNLAGVLGFRGRVFSTLKVAPLPAVSLTPHAKARVCHKSQGRTTSRDSCREGCAHGTSHLVPLQSMSLSWASEPAWQPY